MHHLLWEPVLGPERFFELYCETWRRSVLNLKGRKSVWQWMREVDPWNAIFLLRALRAHRRCSIRGHYLREYDLVAPHESVAAAWRALGSTGGNRKTLGGHMRSDLLCALLLAGQSIGAQAPLKVVDDGVLDRIELFAVGPQQPKQTTVVIRPFDASAATWVPEAKTARRRGNRKREPCRTRAPACSPRNS